MQFLAHQVLPVVRQRTAHHMAPLANTAETLSHAHLVSLAAHRATAHHLAPLASIAAMAFHALPG